MVDPAAALQKSDNRTPAFISDLNIRRGAEPPGGCPSFEMNWAMMGAMVSTHHNLVGLARVSAIVQDAPLQRDALTAAGCGRIFEEKVSTRSSARPGLAAALNYLRPDKGDVLAVWKLDRLGRSVKDVPTIADDLHGRGSGCASSPGNFPAPITRPGKGSSSSR